MQTLDAISARHCYRGKYYELVCVLPVGIAEEEPVLPRKKPFEARAWFNGFGAE